MKIVKPDFTNSIMNVSNSFLHYYGIETDYPGIKMLDIELSKDYDHIIYILLDGMGANIVKEHLNEDDGLRKYMKSEITSVFPPTTVAATNAVLSGVPPISNGFLGWVQYFKNEDTDLTVFLNSDFYTGKRFDVDLKEKYLSYENIVTKVQKHNTDVITNVFFPGFIDGSSVESFKDEIDKVLVVNHNTDKSFSYLYWTQPDLTEHVAGIHSQETKEVLQALNSDFEDLTNEVVEGTIIVVLADHGLTDVEEINLFNYEKLTNMLERKPSIEPRATNFFVKDGFLEKFKIEFNKHFTSKYILLNKDEVIKSNTFGVGVKHKLFDQFLGDYLAIAIDKYMFTLSDSKGYKAHHAGLSEDEMMVPLIIYTK